jgi:hypothetical protein
MDPAQRVVITLPLEELFDSKGAVRGLREESLSRSAISALLAAGVRRFAVANVGQPLRWIANGDIFSFWKGEARDRIVDPLVNAVFLDDFREGLAYFASRWRLDGDEDVIVLEARH